MPRRKLSSSHSCVKLPDSSYKAGISFNAFNGEIIPDLDSDEYEFDAHEYQKWHLDYRFNLDAAASILNHKCDKYASREKSFLDLLSLKRIFTTIKNNMDVFSPIEFTKEIILLFEAIRLH